VLVVSGGGDRCRSGDCINGSSSSSSSTTAAAATNGITATITAATAAATTSSTTSSSRHRATSTGGGMQSEHGVRVARRVHVTVGTQVLTHGAALHGIRVQRRL
jgi:hypothetical protein